MENKDLQIIRLDVPFLQTSLFLESQAGSTTSINVYWGELFDCVLYVLQIQKFTEIFWKLQTIWLVSVLTSLTLKWWSKAFSKQHDICGFGFSTNVFVSCRRCSGLFVYLFDVVTAIDAQCMGRSCLNKSCLEPQCCCVLVEVSALNFSCWAWLSFVWCCCYHHWYHWNESNFALLIIVILNHHYFSSNSLHTCYTP